MATTSYANWVDLVVTVTNSNVDVGANASRVNVLVQLKSRSTTRVWNHTSQSLKVTVDGTDIHTGTFTYDIYNAGTKTLYNGYRTVAHGSDGSKTASYSISASGGGDSGSITGSIKLADIARASVPTVSSSSVSIGSSVKVNFNRRHSGFRHKLVFEFMGSDYSTLVTTGTNVNEHTWTLPNDLANKIPKQTSNGGLFRLETYNGATRVGVQYVTISVVLPNTATFNPTVSAPTWTETVSAISNGMAGEIVNGRSKLRFKAVGSPKFSASITHMALNFSRTGHSSSANMSLSGSTGSYDWSANTAGVTWTVTATVTDSRGRKATSSGSTFVVAPYSPPSLTANAYRHNTNPSTIVVDATSTGYHLSNKNTLEIEVYIKQRTATSWGTVKNRTTSTTGIAKPSVVSFTGYSESTAFDVMVRTKDELNDWRQSIISIGTTKVLMDIYKDTGIGIGQLFDKNSNVAMQLSGGMNAEGNNLINEDGNLNVHDTRMIATPTNMGDKGVRFDFKNNAIDGLDMGGTFHGTMTFQQWGESSGGRTHQLAFTDRGLARRNAVVGATNWNPWEVIYDSGNPLVVSYTSMLNGFNGNFQFVKKSNIVFFHGWWQHPTSTDGLRSDHNLFYPSGQFAPYKGSHLRMHAASWGASTGYPENHAAILRIESGAVIVERSTQINVRFYVYGTYMANSWY